MVITPLQLLFRAIVVGSNGTLTGFGGGLAAKRFLLDLESRNQGLRSSN